MKRIYIILILTISMIFPYNVNALSVTYSFNGQETIKEVEEDKVVEQIENPKREGYIFSGWINQKTLQPFDFDTKITEDIILVPNWKLDKNSNLQKDVAEMIQQDKGKDIFNLEDDNKDKTDEFLSRLKDSKFIIIAGTLLVSSMIILIVMSIIARKFSKNETPVKKEKETLKKCRRCGNILNEEDEICGICKIPVLK